MSACDTCFDTKCIDFGGREITCPDCPRYHPSSVTVSAIIDAPGFVAWDSSIVSGGAPYGPRCSTRDEAEVYARRRRGVIKAALTRRANKAKAADA